LRWELAELASLMREIGLEVWTFRLVAATKLSMDFSRCLDNGTKTVTSCGIPRKLFDSVD
jgi:hypothetical protein